jgi:chlorobactene glucosyltransferase
MTLEYGLLLVLLFQGVFAAVNVWFFVPLRNKSRVSEQLNKKLSVLIPARNEAHNLEALLMSLTLQDDLNFEVIVLDDHSSDDSLEIIRRFALRDSRIMALRGQGLPEGWLGKNYACHQLSNAASGDVLIFTDADTVWSPDGVCLIRGAFERTRADALSAWPEQICLDPLSRLIQPLQQWSLLTFLPMWFVPWRAFPLAVAANGQLIAFKKEMYEQVGGHARVQNSVIEDMSLARLVKRNGGRFALLNAAGVVRTRMYQSVAETWAGYAKNAYPAFGANPLALLLVLILNLCLYVLPWGLMMFEFNPSTVMLVVLSLVPRVMADLSARYDLRWSLLHPISILAWTCISLHSVLWYVRGHVRWKNRDYDLRQPGVVKRNNTTLVLESDFKTRPKQRS